MRRDAFPKAISNFIMNGIVYLVGAGPGDPGLLTVRGREVLQFADVVVYDRLVGEALLRLPRADAETIFVGKEAARHALPQEEINALLVEKARRGKSVCRLKGGDPFVFGRGGEEALHCRANGIAFEIVPGVSSSIAAPAYAGIPITQRDVASSFAVVTGHTKDDDAPPPQLPVADTLVFLMGVRALPKIVAQLLARGESKEKPVALVRWGTTSKQQVVTGTLETIEEEVARAALKPPALIVVGDVVNLRAQLQWFDNRVVWNQTVVVTRAREQASGLVQQLESLGARVVQCPTIQIRPPHEYSGLDAAIENLSSFDWIVFTSTNGVQFFWNRLRERGLDARALSNASIAAIGPSTQEALRERGLEADFVPISSISESVAEGLQGLVMSGQKVLIARAVDGREVLESKMREGGAQVVVAPCYRTVADVSEAENTRELLRRGEIDWVTFTSSSTVRNFIDAIGFDVINQSRADFRIACIGPITARTLRDCGLEPDVVARDAGVESLVEAITGAPQKEAAAI